MATTASGPVPIDESKSAEDVATSIPMAPTPEGAQSAAQNDAVEPGYPSGPRFWLMIFALCLGGFLVSLDGTVLGTAVPVISDEFRSLKDIGWYSSVYFMTMSVPQLLFGKLNARYPIRRNYSAAMLFFMVGSAVCGAAPNSPALIAGRAIAGLGCSGLMVTTLSLVPFLAPPSKRPILIGLFGATLGLGIACGPLMGGVLTQNVSWRWNFYINLPIGAFIYGVFLLLVHPPNPVTDAPTSWGDFWRTLDLLGLAALTPSIVCLLLALQWGGSEYAWDDGRIIALLLLFAVLSLAFLGNEIWQGDKAMLPARILTQRSVISAVLFSLCSSGASIVLVYYIPIWFQGVKGASPFHSGIDTLPLVTTTLITTFLGGVLITMVGHVGPLMVIASVLTAIGAGLFTTFDIATGSSKWIGYQLIYGLGSGFSRQTPVICVQNILAPQDVSIGYGMIMFTQFIAGAIFVPVAQALFANSLVHGLQGLGISNVNASTALAAGVKTITEGLSGDAKTAALHVVNESLIHSWRLSMVLCCVGIIGALAVEHRKVKVKVKDPA